MISDVAGGYHTPLLCSSTGRTRLLEQCAWTRVGHPLRFLWAKALTLLALAAVT